MEPCQTGREKCTGVCACSKYHSPHYLKGIKQHLDVLPQLAFNLRLIFIHALLRAFYVAFETFLDVLPLLAFTFCCKCSARPTL
jgi:hypothetical protein